MPSTVDIANIKPADLPAPPQAAARIVQSCSNPDVGAGQLARIVASDPVLTAEILRTANSAFYGLQREVKSAAQAVTVLGNRALRNIALCLAVRDALRPNAIPGFDMLSYWEDALRRAVASKALAGKLGHDPDEAFTIGLLQDFGLLAMIHAADGKGASWTDLHSALPGDRRELENRLFGITHDKVGLMLARTWSLPASLALPMACHHSLDSDLPQHHRRPVEIANGADWLAAVYCASDKNTALRQCRSEMESLFGFDADTTDAILDRVPAGVEEAASSLGLRVKEQPRLEDVMREASRGLFGLNLEYEELTKKLREALDEKEKLAVQLQEANKQLEQLAYFDPLTGLMNRRRFHAALQAELGRHARNGQPMSLVMVDLDRFKSINDTYGHPFGDTVLQAVAGALRDTLRSTDLKARIGGEEMCIVLPESDHGRTVLTTERVRAAVEALDLSTPTAQVKVTASFGACTWQGTASTPAGFEQVGKHLMDRADAALYKAKNSGRNRCCWVPFEDD